MNKFSIGDLVKYKLYKFKYGYKNSHCLFGYIQDVYKINQIKRSRNRPLYLYRVVWFNNDSEVHDLYIESSLLKVSL